MIKKNFWPLFYIAIFFFLACIVTIRNLGFTKYFIGEDSGLSLTFPDRLFTSVYYMWDSLSAPGKMNISSTFGFLWSNIVLFFFGLGFNDIYVKRIMYILFFFISGSGMFFFLNVLLHIYAPKIQKNIVHLATFTGSLVYMFNPFTIHMANLPIIPYHLSYMVLPFAFGLFIYNLQIRSTLSTILIFSLSAFFLASANPSNTVSISVLFMFYVLVFSKEIKSIGTNKKLFLVITIAMVLLLTSYIYLPIFFAKTNPYGNLGSSADFITSLNINSLFTSFVNLLRLSGGVTWPSFPFYFYYTQNPILIAVSFAMPLLVIASLLFNSHKKVKIFFVIIIVGSIFFAKGSHTPFENIFLFLYKIIPFFGMFRAVYYKFAFFTVLAYAVLLSFMVIYLFRYVKNNSFKHTLFLFIILFIFLYGFPFFSGVIPKQDYLTNIPDDYKELKNLISSDTTDSKVLALPPAPRGAGLLLQWGSNKYVGPHPDAYLINKPVLDSYWFTHTGYMNLTPDDSWTGKKFEDNFTETLPYLGILNIRYLLVHNDFIESYDFGNGDIRKIDGKLKATKLESIIAKQPEIKLIKKSSYFTLYRLPDTLFLPHFYIPETVIYSNEQFKTLFYNKNIDQKTGKYAILPVAQINNKIEINKKDTPIITFARINPSKYKVIIKHAKKPFYIIFSESFDNNWKIGEIEDKNHMTANGYANAWLTDPEKICSVINKCKKYIDNSYDFEMIVEFLPQRLFFIGLFISGTTLLSCLSYLAWSWVQKKKLNIKKDV